MDVTIKNPAVIDPSHIPKIKRTMNRPAKFLQAAWQHSATAQMKMLRLPNLISENPAGVEIIANRPQPLSDREALEGKILRKFEREIAEVEYRS